MNTSLQSLLLRSFLLFGMAVVAVSCGPSWDIDNPYDGVDWDNHGQYKANFHTHTTRSDGRLNPHQVVDGYHDLGYDILAIADHNGVTYPWTAFSTMEASDLSYRRQEENPDRYPENFQFEDRDPAALGMIDIQANELSSHHHMGSFFTDHKRPPYGESVDYTVTEEESIRDVGEKGGLVMLYHPGRYDETVDWYVDFYERYDHLFGLEIFNQGDRYPEDRMIWDSILTVTMPDTPVWGYSNDDMHSWPQLGRNWNMMILPELSHESVREGMESGLSYYMYAPEGHDGPEPPYIESIDVNERRGTIEITARNYDRILWIAEGRVVHEGSAVDLNELPETGSYIRAKLYGAAETIAGTQPFGIRQP